MTITPRLAKAAALWLALAGAGAAADLSLPAGARATETRDLGLSKQRVPVGNWEEGHIPTQTVAGRIGQSAWRIDTQGLTTFQVIEPLKEQLLAQGYEVQHECQARVCGGFDFRFALPLLPAPSMYVSLADYRYLSAMRSGGERAVWIVVSRNDTASFVQITQIVPEGAILSQTLADDTPPRAGPQGALAKTLEARGHVVLSDLAFESGSADLGPGPFQTLSDLSRYLRGNPDRRVVLVGHTDAEGSLDGNIALSKRRASSVRSRLIDVHGVAEGQLTADGIGFLAPVASNLTGAGRVKNRRVEAVLLK